MKIAPDTSVQKWLEQFSPLSENFDWDDGNRNKNRKHGVEWEDVESIFFGDFIFEGRITEPAHSESRYLILGKDWHGRFLTLIFTIRKGKPRAISCRKMRTKERERYEECKEKAERPSDR